MYKAFQWSLRAIVAILSLSTILYIASLFGRWEWIKRMLNMHPSIAIIVSGPFFSMFCLGFCILLIYGKEYLRQPRLVARLMRLGLMSRFDEKRLGVIYGGDGRPTDPNVVSSYDVLVKMHVVNETDNQVTIFKFECYALLKREAPWKRRKRVPFQYVNRLDNYEIPDPEKIEQLITKLDGVPLVRGVGHTGWLTFAGELASHSAARLSIRIIAIDALGHRHKVYIDKPFIQEHDMPIKILLW